MTPEMSSPPPKPLPDLDDPVTGPFWEGTRQGRLTVPRCTNCGYLQWPPEPVCPQCQQTGREWIDVPAEGTLWSYATYHRALDPAYAEDLPYTVGLVELDAGPKMYGILTDVSEDEVEIGRRYSAVFEAVDDAVTFVRWRPVPLP